MTPRAAFASEHAFKLLKNVTERARSLELFREAIEAATAETSSAKASAGEWILATERVLSLFVTSHSRLIVDFALALITQCFVGVVNCCELLLGFRRLVDVRVVLLCQLEVLLLDICL